MLNYLKLKYFHTIKNIYLEKIIIYFNNIKLLIATNLKQFLVIISKNL